MNNQKLYYSNDETLVKEQQEQLQLLYEFNQTGPLENEKRQSLLKRMFAEFGEDNHIEPPFNANWAGKYVKFGKGIYVNFNLTLVDDCEIIVGNNVMFAPNVTLTTGTHPIHPEIRRKKAQYNAPIYIEDNVWLGANVVVLPGVRIGENSVIGAGSVVTKDIPANVVAVGTPCKVLREINEKDFTHYNNGMEIDIE